MDFVCQRAAIEELKRLSVTDRHSILIEGAEGCGKTYSAMMYANMLEISDFQIVEPKVNEVKSAVDACLQLTNQVVLCIENIDLGVPAASYALLKFLEEPTSNVYIVVTCRNIKNVPDTIISRSAVVSISSPTQTDISSYAMNKDSMKFKLLSTTPLWKCVRAFKDADTVLNMTVDQLNYFDNLKEIKEFRDAVSNIVWRISHYDDNTETPVELVIRYIMNMIPTNHIQKVGVDCLNDLSLKRIASHAVLSKFAFEVKYCE